MGNIKTKKVKFKYPKTKVDKLKVCIDGKCTYDEKNGKVEFDITTKDGEGWVLVHDTIIAAEVREGTLINFTSAIHAMEGFDTEQECLDRIKELGLKYTEVEILK